MIIRYILIIYLLVIANIANASHVLALVDGKAITSTDIDKRIEAVKLMSPDVAVDNNLKIQILNNLISEELFNNEAKRLKISITSEEVDNHIKGMQQDFKFSENQTKALMQNKSIRKQFESQLLWSKLVSAVFYSKVKVSDAEVQEEQKLRENLIKEVTFKQILFRDFEQDKIELIRKEATDCNNLDQVTRATGLSRPYSNTLLFTDLNTDLQIIIRGLSVNKLSAPFTLNNQLQVMMLCSKNITQITQNAHQIRQELGTHKINAEAQKYLAELKKRIYVEYVSPIE
jgi:hypothetical protein